jgi:hypothetical protein
MNTSNGALGARICVAALAIVLVATALAGCKTGGTTGQSSGGSTGGGAAGGGAAPAKTIDYATLLTVDDVTRITGTQGVTIMDPGMRGGDSPYYVLFTSPTTPQFLSFRVGKPSFYDEQLKNLGAEATKITVGGNEAFSWDSATIDNSGISVRMPDKSTYVVVSKWLHKTEPGKSQLTMDQLKQVAELVVERSQ